MQNLQRQHTDLMAACGHTIHVRLDTNPVVAADMIATFMARDCGRAACPMAQASKGAAHHHPQRHVARCERGPLMTMIDTSDSRFPKAVAIADRAGQWLKYRATDWA